MKELVLGTAQLGFNYGVNNDIGKLSKEHAFEILDTAYDNGISILDTAPGYEDSEYLIGQYIKEKSRYFNIASKVSVCNSSNIKIHIEEQINKSIKTLNIRKLNYYFVHSFTDVLKNPDIFDILTSFKKQGLIDNIGVSLYDIDQFEHILESYDKYVDIIQIPYNILDLRWIKKGILAHANNLGIKIFARSVYLQGLLFLNKEKLEKIHPKAYSYIELVKKFCIQNNISIQELALEFVKTNKNIDFIVIGCESTSQVLYNLGIFNNCINKCLKEKLVHFVNNNFDNIEKVIRDPRMWFNNK